VSVCELCEVEHGIHLVKTDKGPKPEIRVCAHCAARVRALDDARAIVAELPPVRPITAAEAAQLPRGCDINPSAPAYFTALPISWRPDDAR
jgi:hypothetical protein